MKVFVTGSTGFIGSAIVNELRTAGHQVLGFVRSDAAAATLALWGVEAHRGDLSDTESLAAGAGACDGVIHTAFNHDFSKFAASVETERLAVEALAGALEGSGKALVITSGTALLDGGRYVTEHDVPRSGAHRAASEETVLSAAGRGLRASIVRLPPSVHGAGDHGFVPMLVDIARRTGFAAYLNDGANRWPAVHRLDAARLFRLALEHATPGTRLHGAAEEGIPMRSIAAAIGAGLGLPVRSISPEEAPAHFGFLAAFVGVDNPTSSAFTRATLGWDPQGPQGPQLLADMRESGYFAENKVAAG